MPKSLPVAKDLVEVVVAPDTYHVSPEPMLLVAELHGALGLCLHDEGRGVGGLLHLKFMGGDGPSERCHRQYLELRARGARSIQARRPRECDSSKRDDIQARILAHALPPTGAPEPTASLVDLIQADLADSKIYCGSQTMRRTEPLRVCFQPFEGRVWVCGPSSLGASSTRRSAS